MSAGHDAGSGMFWIASYPKSGNTWVRLFISALCHKAEHDLARMDATSSIANSRTLIEQYVDLGIADLSWKEAAELRPLAYREIVRTAAVPIFLKVHDRCGQTPSGTALFPADATRGCIHLVRDPRDVCLSLAAHMGISADRAIARLGSETVIANATSTSQLREQRGSWSSHARSWLESPLRRLTLRYEDMVADPFAAFTELAAFCDIAASPDDIASAVASTDFATLAAREAETGFRERPEGMARFFRSGRSGGWRDVLTPEQVARIEREHGAMMERLGYACTTPPSG